MWGCLGIPSSCDCVFFLFYMIFVWISIQIPEGMDGPMKHETSARCCASRIVKQSLETACLSGQHWCPIELCSSHIRPKWKPCGMPHCPQSPATLKLLRSAAFKKKYDCSCSDVNELSTASYVIMWHLTIDCKVIKTIILSSQKMLQAVCVTVFSMARDAKLVQLMTFLSQR